MELLRSQNRVDEIFQAEFFNPLALELDIYNLTHHLCKM